MIKVTFDVASTSVNNGKINVEVTNAAGLLSPLPVNTKVFVGITSPLQTEVYAYQEAFVVSGFGATDNLLVDIPKVGVEYLKGSYEVRIRVEDDNDGTPFQEYTASYVFNDSDCNSDYPNLEMKLDCYTGRLIVKDEADYTNETVEAYQLRVQHPVIPNEPILPDTTSTLSQIVVELEYENVTYVASVSGILRQEQTIDNIVFATALGLFDSKSLTIQCDKDACGVIACVEKKIRYLNDKACREGGLSSLGKQDRDLLSLLSVNLQMYNYANTCGNAILSQEYYDRIKALTDDCECDECDKPKKLNAQGDLSYITGDSAYEVWLKQGNIGTEDNFFTDIAGLGQWETLAQPAGTEPYTYTNLRKRESQSSIWMIGRITFEPSFLSNTDTIVYSGLQNAAPYEGRYVLFSGLTPVGTARVVNGTIVLNVNTVGVSDGSVYLNFQHPVV